MCESGHARQGENGPGYSQNQAVSPWTLINTGPVGLVAVVAPGKTATAFDFWNCLVSWGGGSGCDDPLLL